MGSVNEGGFIDVEVLGWPINRWVEADMQIGGGVRIVFQTVPGKRYQVERSLSLPGTWQILDRDLIGDGGVRSVIDSSSPSELRQFYRVRLQP